MNFKLIKKTEFTFDKAGVPTSGVAYVVAHKGRAINVSTLNFEDNDCVLKDNILTVKGDVELKLTSNVDVLTGEITKGLKLMPKMDLSFSID